jgi:hypothetical protein
MPESPRRFPSPWHADPMPGGYVVRGTPTGRRLPTCTLATTKLRLGRRRMRRDGSPSTSRGCRSCLGRRIATRRSATALHSKTRSLVRSLRTRGNCSATSDYMRTPDLSFAASSRLISSFTTFCAQWLLTERLIDLRAEPDWRHQSATLCCQRSQARGFHDH